MFFVNAPLYQPLLLSVQRIEVVLPVNSGNYKAVRLLPEDEEPESWESRLLEEEEDQVYSEYEDADLFERMIRRW